MHNRLGAVLFDDGRCEFCLWAPFSETVHLHLLRPNEALIPMERKPTGYHNTVLEGITPGTRYCFQLSTAKEFPDPASRYQPEGVHGPSEVVRHHFKWHDMDWFGLPIEKYVIYELHVGTFTPEGTFEAIIPHLDELADLGITALELM